MRFMFNSTTSTKSETSEEFEIFKKSVPRLQHKIHQVSRNLKALSHPDRLKIVSLLINAEYTVQSLSKKIGLPQSTVSQHLSILRGSGLVDYRKDGPFSHYSLSNSYVSQLYLTAMQL